MKTKFSVLVIFIIIACVSFFILFDKGSTKDTNELEVIVVEETEESEGKEDGYEEEREKTEEKVLNNKERKVEDVVETSETTKIYRNEDWGFEFEYPANFKILENFSYSAYTQFNLMIVPIEGSYSGIGILINIVLPEFATGSFAPYQNTKSTTTLAGRPADYYAYKWQDLDEVSFITPHREFSLILGATTEVYQKEFEVVLNSFKFIE